MVTKVTWPCNFSKAAQILSDNKTGKYFLPLMGCVLGQAFKPAA